MYTHPGGRACSPGSRGWGREEYSDLLSLLVSGLAERGDVQDACLPRCQQALLLLPSLLVPDLPAAANVAWEIGVSEHTCCMLV